MEPKLKYATIQWWPRFGYFTTVTLIKSSFANSTMSANFMPFFVSNISYSPTDLSLLKEFSKLFNSIQWRPNFHQFTIITVCTKL